MIPSFKDIIAEEPLDALKPPLDRFMPFCDSQDQRNWVETGVVIKPNFIPQDLIEDYCRVRDPIAATTGWYYPTPYMDHAEILNIGLFPELAGLLQSLISEPMGMHLNLTHYVSTERQWHQDDYLNPDFVNSHYAAVWMALDDIHPDSGPFQYVAGSHQWPLIRRERVFQAAAQMGQALTAHDWPTETQNWVGQACNEEITARNGKILTYLPKKGDLLVWHGRLMHRGSFAKIKDMQRKSLIIHYSGIDHRPDMPKPIKYGQLGYFFPINTKEQYKK